MNQPNLYYNQMTVIDLKLGYVIGKKLFNYFIKTYKNIV